MGSGYEQLRKREREELLSLVGWVPVVLRVLLFAVVVGGLAMFLRYLVGASADQEAGSGNPVWWVLPSGLLAIWILVQSRRWAGGRDFRDRIRQDLERGDAAVHSLHVLEGIVVEEREDEGPVVFVQTELSGVIRFAGQYLAREVDRGFPWQEITIREAPSSRVFFGVRGKDGGDTLVRRRGPLTRMEEASLGPFNEEYLRLRMDFETLRSALSLKGEE